MKLLLHTCCAPCAIDPLNEAKKEGFEIAGFFCNSNIQPRSEYDKRKNAAQEYFSSEGLELILPGYDIASFMGTPHFLGTAQKNVMSPKSGVSPYKVSPSPRCEGCWDMRLRKTVTFAKQNRFDMFTTTLLGSPYQAHDVIKKICGNLAREGDLGFYYRDFREGFRDAHKKARERGIYCQNYCGCVFSMVEREEGKK